MHNLVGLLITYDMENKEKTTIESGVKEILLTLASPWQRISAAIADAIIVTMVYWPIYFILQELLKPTTVDPELIINTSNLLEVYNATLYADIPFLIITLLISLCFAILTQIIIPSKIWRGQTFGKKLLGIKVVNTDASEVNSNIMFKRYSLYLLTTLLLYIPYIGFCFTALIGLMFIINVILLFAESRNQTLNDKYAKTVVIQA